MHINPGNTKSLQRPFYRPGRQPGTASLATGDHFSATGLTRLTPSNKRSLHASPIARQSPLPKAKLTGYEAHQRLARHLLKPNTPTWAPAKIGGKSYNLELSLDPSRKANPFVINNEGAIVHPRTAQEDFAIVKPSSSDLYDYAINDGTVQAGGHVNSHPIKIVAGEIITVDGVVIQIR